MTAMVPKSITRAVSELLQRHELPAVLVAGSGGTPPVLSHIVNFPRLEIPVSGIYENEIEQDGRIVTLQLQPGESLFAPPNCWNRPTWRRRVKVLSILFGKSQTGISLVAADGGSPGHIRADKLAVPVQHGATVQAVMDAMMEAHRNRGPAASYPYLVKAMLHGFTELVRSRELPAPGRVERLMEQIRVYLQNNYQYDVTRDSTAMQFGISPNHLSRLFRTHGYVSFTRYLTYVRMDRAKYLLKTYPINLDEIARRCGYRDAPYFCRVFRRIVKRTPGSFRPRACCRLAR